LELVLFLRLGMLELLEPLPRHLPLVFTLFGWADCRLGWNRCGRCWLLRLLELAWALDLGLELMLDAELEAQLDLELGLCSAMEPELALGPVEGAGPLLFDNDCRR
jgi:hypothetical protein